MCKNPFKGPKMPKAAPMIIPAANNAEAMRQAELEAALRRRRGGAAANILTGPMGIPSGQPVTRQLGGVAQ